MKYLKKLGLIIAGILGSILVLVGLRKNVKPEAISVLEAEGEQIKDDIKAIETKETNLKVEDKTTSEVEEYWKNQ